MLHQTSKVAMVMAMNVIIIIRLVTKYIMAAWSVSKVTELIDLLQQYPCFYDTKDKKYHKRDVRGKAVTEIANALKQSGELKSFQYYQYWN